MFSMMHSIHDNGYYHSAFFNSMCELWNRMAYLPKSILTPDTSLGRKQAKKQAMNPALCKEWHLPQEWLPLPE